MWLFRRPRGIDLSTAEPMTLQKSCKSDSRPVNQIITNYLRIYSSELSGGSLGIMEVSSFNGQAWH